MKNEQIEKLIDDLNAGQMVDRVFRTKLAPTVEYARVWLDEPTGKAGNEGSYEFYFVMTGAGICVGAVLDMVSDFHVFVKEDHRKKGHLSKAMNEIILPYLYQQGRKEQLVTFRDPQIGAYCERNWGFSLSDSKSAKKDLRIFASCPAIVGQRRLPSHEEVRSMKIKINRARLYLTMVKEQVDLSCGPIDDLGLEDLIDQLFALKDRIGWSIQDAQGHLEA
ncbi:MAG: hypothetical protein AABO41_21965 [Acidobacteriota bacterium]